MTEPYQPTPDATRTNPGAGLPPSAPAPQSQPRTGSSSGPGAQPSAAVPSEPTAATTRPDEVPAGAPEVPAAPEAAPAAEPLALDQQAADPGEPTARQAADEAEQAPPAAQEHDQVIASDPVVSDPAATQAAAVDPAATEAAAVDPAATEAAAVDPAATQALAADAPEADPDAPVVDPAPAEALASNPAPATDIDDLFRSESPSAAAGQTAVLSAPESARLRRQERAAARERSLGQVRAAETPDAPEPVVPFTTPSTYKPFPSLGFLLLRLVVVGVLGVRAWRHWAELALTRQVWDQSLLRNGALLSWVTIGLEIGIALMLLLGLGTRVAGFLLLAYAVVLLAFVDWGAADIIQPGYFGFLGDLDLVLAVLGLFFVTVGGGRAGIDGSIYSGRVQRKNDRLVA